MSRDLDLYQSGGDLAPYSPGRPLAPSDWGSEPDYLSNRETDELPHTRQPFTDPQVEQNFKHVAATFHHDFTILGHPQKYIDAAMNWFRQSLMNPPGREPKRHNYNLFQYSNDQAMNAFANYATTIGIGQRMMENICWWINELENVLHSTSHAPGQGRPTFTNDPLDSLTDSEYDQVLQINENARSNTLGQLRDLWGSSFHANLAMVNSYFAKLPIQDQKHLSQFTTGWIAGTNTKEIILHVFQMAIGANSIPKSGAAIAQEIAQHEMVMRTDRKRWNSDEQLQARYRTLLDLRDGR